MKSSCVILLDDLQRVQEQDIVEDWSNQFSLVYKTFGVLKKYAYIEANVSNE